MSFHEDSFHQTRVHATNPANSITKVLHWLVDIRNDVWLPTRPDVIPDKVLIKKIYEQIDLLIFYLEESKGDFKLIYPERTISV